MIGLLVVTHGDMGADIVEVARKIVRSSSPMDSISIDWNDDVPEARARIEEAIQRLDQGQGVLVATDMLGGTPANLAMAFLEPERVEVVTGVNLPMVIKFNNLEKEFSLKQAASTLADKARSHITIASEILSGPSEDGDA